MAALAKNLCSLRLPVTNRLISWAEFGSPTGRPLIYLHCHRGGRLERWLLHEAFHRRNIRFIVPDRPGYGRSEFAPGRTIGSYAADIQALTAHLRLSEYSVMGSGGGGPYALACARYIRPEDGLRGVSLVASPAPYECGLKGVKWSEAMNVYMSRWLPNATRHILDVPSYRNITGPLEEWTPGWSTRAMMKVTVVVSMALDRDGREAMATRPGFVDELAEAWLEADLQGPGAKTDDRQLRAHPWDFRLEDISYASQGKRPLVMWYGTKDTTAPVHMGRWIAEKVRGSQLREVKGATNEETLSGILDHCEDLLQISRL